MSTQFDSLDTPHWGGLQLAIDLNLIDPETTEVDVRRDREKLQQLKRAYRVLGALGVGKVNGRFVATPRELRERLARAASNERCK